MSSGLAHFVVPLKLRVRFFVYFMCTYHRRKHLHVDHPRHNVIRRALTSLSVASTASINSNPCACGSMMSSNERPFSAQK